MKEITSKKARGSKVGFSTIEITSKMYVETRWIFRPSKLHRKKYVETTKRREFFDQRNYIEKVRGNDVEIRRNLVFDVPT